MSVKFLLDGMLGTLARWLRISGYDAEYLRSTPDKDLVDRASEEDRILLTRDKLLYRKAIKAGAEAMLVKGEDDVERLSLIVKKYGLVLHPQQSRCPKCNGLLENVDKDIVKDKIPKRTYKAFDEFFVCSSCGQVYWRGSHWNSIVDTLRRTSNIAARDSNKAKNDLYDKDPEDNGR